ncbi:MAG: calcium/sodium antiporter [Gammaproteobacteria bacterium]
MLMYSAAIIVGLALLIWGADLMVVGASVTARRFGVSPMLVGLTIVGFATSAPEILVAIAAALSNAPNLAIGNAIGSNIANIGLIGGATAVAYPLVVHSQTLRRELPVMVAVSIVPAIFVFDSSLSRLEGFLMLAMFVGFMYWIVQLGLRTRGHDSIEQEYASEIPTDVTIQGATLRLIVGLAALSLGARSLVWGSEAVATALGISDMIIGITIVALGTSLPELAVSLASARKGEHSLAFGNIIGSNGFNALAVIGITAAIQPAELDPSAVSVHIPAMLAFTVAFFFMAYNWSGKITVSRTAGALLLTGYIAYMTFIATQTF